ncbi:MAG: urea amidolyase associated protein UAAP1 [Pseudomonadota bacterium]
MLSDYYEDDLPGGKHWSFVLRRGVEMTLTDLQGGGNVGMLMYNPMNPLERLNLPDTLKCQHTFKLTTGHCLYSDMGRIFCSITHDTLGWHDAAGGTCNNTTVETKWGDSSYQDERNDVIRSGRDCFLIELGKYGLGKRDLAANVNWFSRIDIDANGNMILATGAPADAKVKLRFEMDTLVIMHTCPHPMSEETEYPRKPIRFQLGLAPPVTEDDVCVTSREENRRGFENNAIFHLGL